ncbi:MAG: hypothetical protein KDA37_05995 [Planctomycetales bacterium]|nr:hypothetical protein [Planctomycetales bacterium]
MKIHDFTLVLTTDPSDHGADELYSAFDDGTLVTVAGVPQVLFHRDAESLEEAISTAIRDVRSVGFEVARAEIAPAAVAVSS